MDIHKIKELRAKGKALEPIVHMGKEGLSPNVIAELQRQLKAHKLIKIKITKEYFTGKDKKAEAQAIADAVNAELIELVGFVVVLADKRQ